MQMMHAIMPDRKLRPKFQLHILHLFPLLSTQKIAGIWSWLPVPLYSAEQGQVMRPGSAGYTETPAITVSIHWQVSRL